MVLLKKFASFMMGVAAVAMVTGCEDDGGSSGSGGGGGSAADSVGAPAGVSTETIVFQDDGSVGSWPITTVMRAVSVDGSYITMVYDDVDWPGSGNPTVNGNCWLVYEKGGTWYASTFDFLRPNQETKEVQPDAREFGISSGEQVGAMVSTLARDSRRNGNERSQIYWFTWP